MSIVAVPEVLREKLGPEGALALVELLNRSSQKTREDVIVLVEERFERRLAEVVGGLETRLTRWMFIFWVGQIGAILGILFAFFKR